MRPTLLLLVLTAAAGLPACRAEAGRDADRPRVPEVPASAWTGPPVEADVLVMESFPEQYAAVVSTTVPSGGHRLALDDARLDGDVLHVRVTLERPAAGEMTTQALETLTVRHGTGTSRIREVRVLGRVHRRGETPPAAYAEVARRQ